MGELPHPRFRIFILLLVSLTSVGQRVENFVINPNGLATKPESDDAVAVAKAEYYLSKMGKSPSLLSNNSTLSSLRRLCSKFSIAWQSNDKKSDLIQRLAQYYVSTPRIYPL